jgi:hypothetical protein
MSKLINFSKTNIASGEKTSKISIEPTIERTSEGFSIHINTSEIMGESLLSFNQDNNKRSILVGKLASSGFLANETTIIPGSHLNLPYDIKLSMNITVDRKWYDQAFLDKIDEEKARLHHENIIKQQEQAKKLAMLEKLLENPAIAKMLEGE